MLSKNRSRTIEKMFLLARDCDVTRCDAITKASTLDMLLLTQKRPNGRFRIAVAGVAISQIEHALKFKL